MQVANCAQAGGAPQLPASWPRPPEDLMAHWHRKSPPFIRFRPGPYVNGAISNTDYSVQYLKHRGGRVAKTPLGGQISAKC